MLDLTVPMVEVWFAGAKLGEYANDLEALKAASLHADSLPLTTEKVEYEIRRDTMKYIVHRRITGPDAPALGPVLTISSTALTVTLDRPATGPTTIDRYELERYNGAAWVQIASGLSIFGASNQYADSSLTASTAYQYRCRAVDTTERVSDYSYSTGTTSAGAANQAPVWTTVPTLSIQAGSSVDISGYCSDPEGDQLVFSKVSSTYPPGMTMSPDGVLTCTSAVPAGAQSMVVKADDGALSANKTINLTVSVPSTGNEFFVATGVVTFNASQVQPGDTITIRRGTGTRGALKISGAQGTSGNRITIRNEAGGLLTIAANTTFVLDFENCRYVDAIFNQSMTTETIDGKSISYGLVVQPSTAGGSFTSLMKTSGTTSFLKISNFKLDGRWTTFGSTGQSRVGIQTYANIGRSSGTTPLWTQGIELSSFVIRNISGEGVYGGGNFYNPAYACNRDMNMHDGIIEDCGREAIQAKSWLEGTNRIWNIDVRRVGRNTGDADQTAGISVIDGNSDIYNCRVFGAGGQGIQYYHTVQFDAGSALFENYGPYTVMVSECYNNICASNGLMPISRENDGITVGAAPGSIKPRVHVYSNTTVNNPGVGISTNGNADAATVVENNISLGNTGGALSISGGGTGVGNYTTGSVAATMDVTYHLIAERAAAGTIVTNYSSTDIAGTSRAGTASRGAYEYS